MAINPSPSGKGPRPAKRPTVRFICAHCAGNLSAQQQQYRTEFQIGKGRLWLTAAQIITIEASAHYCDLYMLLPDRMTDVKHVVLNAGIGHLDQLGMPGIVRVHRETMVNLAQVYSIEGTKLKVYHKEDEADIRALFPNATFASLPTGHWVHAEDPEGFVRVVKGFVGG
jgi:pimeloyl-ACP methyl ester carboxylesterase